METYIHPAVKIVAAVYILYRVWIILFRGRLFGLWDRIPVRQKPKKTTAASRKQGVVGKTETSYLAEDPRAKPQPTPVPDTPAVEPEPEEDFDTEPDPSDFVIENRPTPTEDEFEMPEDNGPAPELDYSSGLTFEQLREVIGFMAAPTPDEDMKTRTAETLMSIRHTDVFSFIESEVTSTDAIGRLFEECLDETGQVLAGRRAKSTPLKEFDIDRYV